MLIDRSQFQRIHFFRILTLLATLLVVGVCGYLPSAANAQSAGVDSDEGEAPAVEIPTEVSQPPYAVGELVVEQGYYLDRGEDATRINVRFEDNKLRLYWIDSNGLIAEPESDKAIIRFLGDVRGRNYHQLEPLADGGGLGSAGILPPPHLFTFTVYVPPSGERPELTFNVRYTQQMDVAVDPTLEDETSQDSADQEER